MPAASWQQGCAVPGTDDGATLLLMQRLAEAARRVRAIAAEGERAGQVWEVEGEGGAGGPGGPVCVGLDVEWKPQLTRGSPQHPASILQVLTQPPLCPLDSMMQCARYTHR